MLKSITQKGRRKMKKALSLLLVLAMLLPLCALGEVIVISSPDMKEPVYKGTIDNILIGEGIDLGDRILMPFKSGIVDRLPSWDLASGANAEYVYLWIDVTNMASQKQYFFKEAVVTVTYTNSRGDYVFGGNVRQSNNDSDFYRGVDQTAFFEIAPLYLGHYMFYCAVPNYVKETEGPIVMKIQIGETVMTHVIRSK